MASRDTEGGPAKPLEEAGGNVWFEEIREARTAEFELEIEAVAISDSPRVGEREIGADCEEPRPRLELEAEFPPTEESRRVLTVEEEEEAERDISMQERETYAVDEFRVQKWEAESQNSARCGAFTALEGAEEEEGKKQRIPIDFALLKIKLVRELNKPLCVTHKDVFWCKNTRKHPKLCEKQKRTWKSKQVKNKNFFKVEKTW